jgi:hypothetical protein
MAAQRTTSRGGVAHRLFRRPWWALLAPLVLAVGCPVESLPPAVVYATPANGSGNVPVATSITATFSRPMEPTTITAATFTLTQNGIPVAGTVTSAGKTATFVPTASLPPDATLIATITTGAKDANGVALAADQAWTFMTVATPVTVSVALYYAYTLAGGTWSRSSVPVSVSNGPDSLSQAVNPDGSVTLTTTNPSGGEDNGFYFSVGTLNYLNSLSSLSVAGTGSFSANLYLDVDNDGEFFTWTPPANTVYAGLGSDQYYTGPSAVAGVLTINATSTFAATSGPAASYTLARLRSGAVPGVNGNTRAAIWLGFGGTGTATIGAVTRN